jgi:hypothetical protein
MKVVKNMMDGMMPVMMKGLDKEDKMELMDKMMPHMLAGVSMVELMPKMMIQMLPVLVQELKDMGIQTENILPKLMGKIMPMMDMMDTQKMVAMRDKALEKMMQDEKMRKFMPECFIDMMPAMVPGFLEHFLKELPQEKREEFTKKMIHIFLNGVGEEGRKKIAQSSFNETPNQTSNAIAGLS